VVRLRDHASGDKEFYFVINHLARGDDQLRLSQAKMLREWADRQTLPVIIAGDMNFDYEFANEDGNASFDAFMEGDVFEWIKPDPLIDSNWADIDPTLPTAERTDRFPGSILDFVFAAKGAKDWVADSDVVVRDGDFPDTGKTSDHRPIVATFRLPD
jgi:endonuclease/exonuclease/phosphatase family metal-dependent hydrolase